MRRKSEIDNRKSEITLEVEASVRTAVEPSERVCRVAAMFGLGVDEEREMAVVPRVSLTLAAGRVVFVTGASGGGKSTLLRVVREKLVERGVCVVDFSDRTRTPTRTRNRTRSSCPGESSTRTITSTRYEYDEKPIVEGIGGTLEDAVRWLSLAGLGDAFVMLRKPSELSEGQRYRWLLAQLMRSAECGVRNEQENSGDVSGSEHSALRTPHSALTVVLADEFGSTLDRLTAAVVARGVRKWVTRAGVCFIAATAHDDLLEHLEPDAVVVFDSMGSVDVMERRVNG